MALTSFIGRATECAAVQDLLTTARLVTLTGPGGCGKTRLALQVARAVSGGFADGVSFIDLASISDPALVTSAIAVSLGVRETGGQPLEAGLKAALRDQPGSWSWTTSST